MAVLKIPKLTPTESTSIGSVPVRKPTPFILPKAVITDVDNSTLPEGTSPTQEGKDEAVTLVEEAPVEAPATFPPAVTQRVFPPPVPVRAAPAIRGQRPEELVASVEPQLVAEAKTYRFGKTTEAVKNMFVGFIEKLFEVTDGAGMPTRTTEETAQAAKISPALAETFMKRLLEIKGARGLPLLEKRDGKLHSNYLKDYIIAYATAEQSREKAK
jgi:hypothetical protein